MNTLMPHVFPDVRHEVERTIVSARAYAKETRSYREPDYRDPKYDTERRLAAALIAQSIRDYHMGKKLAIKKKIRCWLDCKNNAETELLANAMDAYAWFTSPPTPNGSGWTLEKCCDVLGLDKEQVSAAARLPSSYRALMKQQGGLSVKDIANKYADIERAAMLLDDVEQSIAGALKAARYKQLWDEEEVPIDAWHSDVQSALKLLVKNL